MCPAYPADPERPLPPVGLWDEHPASRSRPIRPSMNPGMQVLEVGLQIQPVFPPRHTIDPRGRVRADRPKRLPQTIDSHVMKKRGEPHILVLPRHLAHTIQIASHTPSGAASRDVFRWPCFPRPVPFPSPPPPPPPQRACSAASQVVRDRLTSHGRSSRAYRHQRSPHDPARCRSITPRTIPDGHPSTPRATAGPPGSRAQRLPCVPRFSDRAGSHDDSR